MTDNTVKLPEPVALTAEDRAMHYIRWHALAYGCAAPTVELSHLLYRHFRFTETQTHDLLVRLERAGKIDFFEGRFSDGWREVEANDKA